MLLYIKLGMTMNEHSVLKNNCKHQQIYKELQIYKRQIKCGKHYVTELNLTVIII